MMSNKQHIDDWLDTPNLNCSQMEAYARFVLEFYRLPAWKQNLYQQFMNGNELYCTYNNVRYKVTGASRFGDVYLNSNLDAISGYTLRVAVSNCGYWGSV